MYKYTCSCDCKLFILNNTYRLTNRIIKEGNKILLLENNKSCKCLF